jgi:hypothetical protein
MYWVTALATLAAAGLFFTWLPIGRRRSGGRHFSALWVTLAAAPLAVLSVEHGYIQSTRSKSAISDADALAASIGLESIAWPGSTSLAPRSPPITWRRQEEAPMSAAPISALVDGLESRLATEPEDTDGWVLLAQSYAFLGESQEIEAAIARAVELGFDEVELRHRVELAKAN